MKKNIFLSRLLFSAPLLLASPFVCGLALPAVAQEPPAAALHVVKSSINAEADNAELCLEFDKQLAALSPARLAAALHLESDDKQVTPQNIDATAASLCLFPLDRAKAYRLSVTGLRGAQDEKMAEPYTLSFTIPDRSPLLAFSGKNGAINGFGSYDDALALRAINVARAKITVYRLSDPAAMARAWQERAQTALAPSESAYLARTKGQQIWQSDSVFADALPNDTIEQKISLHDKLPDLAPGLYLIVADANTKAADESGKGLAPLAAAWFTKADFSLRAFRDSDGIHTLAATTDKLGAKASLHLMAMNKAPDMLAETQGGAEGVDLLPYPATLANKGDVATVVATDAVGNVAFADIENLPGLTHLPPLGVIRAADVFATPGAPVDLALSLAASGNAPSAGSVRLSRADSLFTDFPVPPLNGDSAKLSFTAPALQGAWALRWQKNDGTILADAPLRLTSHTDAPYLQTTSDRDALTGDAPWPVTIKSLTNAGKPAPLVSGHVMVTWQRLDPVRMGWKNYQFGTPAVLVNASTQAADFLTDLEGTTELRINLPPRPQEPGLYQAALTTVADRDAGVADAPPLILPLRPDATVIGVHPVAVGARFAQNGIARFALIGLSSEGKPRDVSGLSYQVYEEGRSFAWYQDQGRWQYKPEPQLRPIGGGPLSIKADGSSVLEWPVNAGNYRLEILDSSGKRLAQTAFSAGWDSTGTATTATAPLSVTLPKILQPAHEAVAHFTLAEPAMVTAIIADTKIRKVIHEARGKGDNTIAFTPEADGQKGLSLSITARPENKTAPVLQAEIEAALAQEKPAAVNARDVGIVTPDAPAALMLRNGESATVNFGIENRDTQSASYRYSFTASSGLKIESGDKGTVTLNGRQRRSLPVSISADQIGVKELRLEVTGTDAAGAAHASHSWNLVVRSKNNFLSSTATNVVTSQQPLIAPPAKNALVPAPTVALVARHSMDGVAELLAYAFQAHPFTTEELALNIDVLRLWGDTLAHMDFAPEPLVTAKRQEWLLQLLRHQNGDGGFAPLRGGDSTMMATATALTTLGPDSSALAAPARNLAIAWLKQRLSNTWFDEKERNDRAAAYAALAAADAIDPASLHYFSDTSAGSDLPALAEIHIAAAFRHMRDPNAAAFWIKKMLDAHGHDPRIESLNALAATDALSSDDVRSAITATTDELRKGHAPALTTVAGLLRAIAADNADAGNWKLLTAAQPRIISGALAVRVADPATPTLRNGDTQPVFVTLIAESNRSSFALPQGSSISRHVYRLNGVELDPQGKPARGEIYMVELNGQAPDTEEGQAVLMQEGSGSALRPIGCPLSAKLDIPAFIPWFSPQNLTAIRACEMLPHELNAVFVPQDNLAFNVVYFARIDAKSLADLVPPRLRVLPAQ